MSISKSGNTITLNIEAVQLKRKNAAEWAEDSTTILKAGEIGVELDTGKLKVGDGVKTWGNLPYVGGESVAVINDLTTGGITDALSAEQGKTLKGLIDDINNITVIDCGTISA